MAASPIVDAHLDLAWNVSRGRDVTEAAADQPIVENETATVGLPDLHAGDVDLVCGTLFALKGDGGYHDQIGAAWQAFAQLKSYYAWAAGGLIRPVQTAADLDSKGLGLIVLMEGADPINLDGRDGLESPAWWFERGVRMVGMAWGQTRFAGGTAAPGPLTDDGRRLVRELDQLGMIHDASHLAEASLEDLLDLATGPVCASHSNCRAIVRDDPRGRHLPDGQIRAIVGRNGVIGINLLDSFLLPPGELATRRATLADVVAHVRHVCDLAGDDHHVGLGSDLDGGFGRERVPEELHSAADLGRLGDALSTGGFGDDAVARILCGNWRAFFRQSLPGATNAATG